MASRKPSGVRSLRDKKCFITGAASGIGRATAKLAAAEGAELFLTDVEAGKLDVAVAEIRESGGTVSEYAAFDVSSYEAVSIFSDRIHSRFGSLDVVMNIAGISVWGAIENLSHAQWRKVIEVNLMGPIHVLECFVPEMIRADRGGQIVNVSSAAGLFGLPWHAAYSASKFGLRGISEVLRFDLERHGIGVSLVCPGGVDTGLVETLEIAGVSFSPSDLDRMRRSFRKHAVTPEHAAAAIIRGLKRNQYLVFTSRDIRIGYWAQTKLSFLYERAMRRLNDRMHRVARTKGRSGAPFFAEEHS